MCGRSEFGLLCLFAPRIAQGSLNDSVRIEIENFERALNIIEQQLDDLRKGRITDQELEQTQTMLSNQLREMQDRPNQLIDFYYHGVLSGRRRSLDDILSETQTHDKR